MLNKEVYFNVLKEEFPDCNFLSIEKKDKYGDKDIYEVVFETEILGEKMEASFSVIDEYKDFDEEKQKENFIIITQATIKGLEKSLEKNKAP